MSRRKRGEIQDWRRFELMVASLERVLRTTQHVFCSPDYLVDTETNERREVDCSITMLTPDGEERISIECRRRGTKEDVTWIEQLATKRRALKLSGTIAVSSKGFSKAAYLKAKHHDITLNTYRELQLGLNERPLNVVHVRRTWSPLHFTYEVSDGCTALSQEQQALVNARTAAAVPDTPLLRVLGTNEVFTLGQLVESALNSSTKPQHEPSKERKFKANLLRPTTIVDLPDSITLRSVGFNVEVRIEQMPSPEPTFGHYSGVEGLLLEVARVKVPREGGSLGLDIYFKTLEPE